MIFATEVKVLPANDIRGYSFNIIRGYIYILVFFSKFIIFLYLLLFEAYLGQKFKLS